jgi:hypothetical protein
LPRGMQAKLLLKLQRTHRRKGAKMVIAQVGAWRRLRQEVSSVIRAG